jgi:hypothetical protein
MPRRQHSHLYELAKRGGEVELREWVQEAENPIDLFPDLRDSYDPRRIADLVHLGEKCGSRDEEKHRRPRRRRRMSAASREAISARMPERHVVK